LLQARDLTADCGDSLEIVDTSDPRKGPKGKLPFIEDGGRRIADTSLIVDHLARTRGVDLDAHLDASQQAIALLVQRTLEEHYAFVVLYTHFIRAEGWRHTCATFDNVPAIIRPVVETWCAGACARSSGRCCATRMRTSSRPGCGTGALCWR
jgi:glutathione S-transferase